MVVKTQLGAWMETERLSRGLTKGAISEAIGISVGQYSSYVVGKSVPRGKTLGKIAKAYNKPVADIQQMLVPLEAEAVSVAPVAEAPAVSEDATMAHISLLEAKLDYAVKLLEQLTRS